MSLSLPHDTLAWHLSRPLSQAVDRSEIPLSSVAAQLVEYLKHDDHDSNPVPDTEALWFYGMNHGMAEIRKQFALHEPLGDVADFVNSYYDQMSEKAVRAFYYLLIICARESRHVHSQSGMYQNMTATFGPQATAFATTVNGTNATTVVHTLTKKTPQTTIGKFVGSLRWVFYNGKFNKGYGGPAWGQVADCLEKFVTGKYSAEMMLDTVWTLSHNNGPIYNKGTLYRGYTGHLLTILDIQRSGQVPEAIRASGACGIASLVPDELEEWMQWLKDRFPDAVGDYVDWFQVEALGAVQKYEAHKKKQVATHGPSPVASQVEAAAKMMAVTKAIEEKAAAAAKGKDMFEIMPGLVVKKFSRPKKAA